VVRKLLVIQIDGLQDPAAWLIEFCAGFPDVAIVLVSRHFARNDLTGERRMIADASIADAGKRVPFAMAVTAALSNHDEYLARRII
jgi:hypothetical protein